MKILLVIHGYPPHYNAGSEIYTQTLAHALVDLNHDVHVFAREEDPFAPDYQLREEADITRDEITVHLVNHYRSNARFQNSEIDVVFGQVLETVQPDVVHFGHLNHLSFGLPQIAKSNGLPVLFTLHDFWIMCPRGQFLQWGLTGDEPWKHCDGQEDSKCAERCFNRFIEGINPETEFETWTRWVRNRMAAIRDTCNSVDLFIAPSRHLAARHVAEFGLNPEKVVYLDYGFDLERLSGRARIFEEPFVFGYIGRHHPSKGIDLLIDAFGTLNGDSLLRIWGRTEGQLSKSLRGRITAYGGVKERIEWLPEYRNEDIVTNVFNKCDCVVVPSIWDENSPLVIHEAQQCGVPVITAGYGGMGEYVRDGINGFTFRHSYMASLQNSMQLAISDSDKFEKLGSKGYLYSRDGQIPAKEEHATAIISHYERLLGKHIVEVAA